jgi:hypothetical protein
VHYKQLKEIVKLLEKDLEKEVEVDEWKNDTRWSY